MFNFTFQNMEGPGKFHTGILEGPCRSFWFFVTKTFFVIHVKGMWKVWKTWLILSKTWKVRANRSIHAIERHLKNDLVNTRSKGPKGMFQFGRSGQKIFRIVSRWIWKTIFTNDDQSCRILLISKCELQGAKCVYARCHSGNRLDVYLMKGMKGMTSFTTI